MLFRSEATILRDLRAGRLYEPDVSQAIARIVGEGDVVVDVGANIGYFSALLGAIVGSSGRVLSFEPGAENLARLRANLAANALANVTIVEAAASDAAGDIAFYVNRDNSAGNALWNPGLFPGNDKSKANASVVRLRATTLDDEIQRLGLPLPKLIKIDTEGAEHKVLQGARRLLQGAAVPYVLAELHAFGLTQMGSSQEALRGFMEGFGYSTFALYFDGSLPKLIPPGVLLTSPFIINLLFSTPSYVAAVWRSEVHRPDALAKPYPG